MLKHLRKSKWIISPRVSNLKTPSIDMFISFFKNPSDNSQVQIDFEDGCIGRLNQTLFSYRNAFWAGGSVLLIFWGWEVDMVTVEGKAQTPIVVQGKIASWKGLMDKLVEHLQDAYSLVMKKKVMDNGLKTKPAGNFQALNGIICLFGVVERNCSFFIFKGPWKLLQSLRGRLTFKVDMDTVPLEIWRMDTQETARFQGVTYWKKSIKVCLPSLKLT